MQRGEGTAQCIPNQSEVSHVFLTGLAARKVDCEQSLFFFRFSKGSPSVSRVAIRVSRVLLDGLQKKERLLVVYSESTPKDDYIGILFPVFQGQSR